MMNWFNNFFGSYYFLTFFIAWLSTCIIKAILRSYSEKKRFSLVLGFQNGGMPSSHSATVASITVAIGLTTGFSSVFFVSLVLSLIVISDAFGVRRNIGQQGEVINEILKQLKKNPVRVVYGHSFFQVIIGTLWGAAVAVSFYFLYFF